LRRQTDWKENTYSQYGLCDSTTRVCKLHCIPFQSSVADSVTVLSGAANFTAFHSHPVVTVSKQKPAGLIYGGSGIEEHSLGLKNSYVRSF